MKTIKVIFFLIILGILGTVGYQNQEYFLSNMALHIDITLLEKTYFQYTARELPNAAYWGICLVVGFLFAGFRGMVKSFRLRREIKRKTQRIDKLKGEINSLKTELDVYIHDPYIKKHLENKAAEAEAANQAAENPEKEEESPEENQAEENQAEESQAENSNDAEEEKTEGNEAEEKNNLEKKGEADA